MQPKPRVAPWIQAEFRLGCTHVRVEPQLKVSRGGARGWILRALIIALDGADILASSCVTA